MKASKPYTAAKFILVQKYFIYIIAFSTIINGCDFSDIELDKVQGPTIDNTFAVNIGNIKYTVDELVESLEDETLEVVEGDDLFLSFVYRDTSLFDDIDEFVKISDVFNEDSFAPFDTDIPPSGSASIVAIPTESFEFEFNPDKGEQIDSTFFKGGTLQYVLTSDFDVQIDYVFTLNDIRELNDDPIVFVRTLAAGASSDSQSLPLDGLKNVSRRVDSVNIFNVTLDLVFHIPAGKSIGASDEIKIELEFLESEFSAIFGNFGTDPVEVQRDSIEISAFDEFNEGGLVFNDPSITIDFVNAFGVELGVSLDGIKSVDSNESEIILSGEVIDNLQFVEAPDETQLGQTIASTLTIDKLNSNVDELLNSTPQKIIFDVTATPNPPGSDNLNNYLFDSSYLEIRTSIEIPLDFRMNGFSKDFDLSIAGSDLEDADSLTINIQVLNEIPFDGVLDLSFKDSEGNELYRLAEIGLIESPETFSGDRIAEPMMSTSAIKLDSEGIEAFLLTSDIVATMNIFTIGNESGDFVKIFSDYKLEIFLTAEGKVSVDL
ncbi:hypothetical protein [Ekhidna sp.]